MYSVYRYAQRKGRPSCAGLLEITIGTEKMDPKSHFGTEKIFTWVDAKLITMKGLYFGFHVGKVAMPEVLFVDLMVKEVFWVAFSPP